ASRGVDIAFVVDVRHPRPEGVAPEAAHLAQLVLGRGLDDRPEAAANCSSVYPMRSPEGPQRATGASTTLISCFFTSWTRGPVTVTNSRSNPVLAPGAS